MWHLSQSNFLVSAQATIFYTEFDIYTFEIAAPPPPPPPPLLVADNSYVKLKCFFKYESNSIYTDCWITKLD